MYVESKYLSHYFVEREAAPSLETKNKISFIDSVWYLLHGKWGS